MKYSCNAQMEEDPTLNAIVDLYRNKPEQLIAALLAVQKHYGYLPEGVMRSLAKELKVPFSKIYGVATFYSQFRLKPRGRHLVSVCLGTACQVRGGEGIYRRVKRELGVKLGGTTPDGRFTLETVSCVGACGMAPVVIVNEDTHGRQTPEKAIKVIKSYE
ncbi:MAG: NADH-quinone oxidoreductase subunit NuoE [Bacillota bacterium]